MAIMTHPSTGLLRQHQPIPLNRREVRCVVIDFVAEQEAARIARGLDPFGIDDPCPANPAGHHPHASCGEVVCVHCERIFWR
jgi:hypothetical protein